MNTRGAMKTREEKMAVLAEAMQIMAEEIARDDADRSESPSFYKYRDQVIELHRQGYTIAGIARELNTAVSSVSDWVSRLGLKKNKVTRDGPGAIPRKKSLTGKVQKYTLLTVKEQNKKLKEERNHERQDEQPLNSHDDGIAGSESVTY
jgi:transposase-like protein